MFSRRLFPLHSVRTSVHNIKFCSFNTLSFEQYGDKAAPKTAIFIHGMLGSKKNMRTPCREFIKLNPNYTCLTVDVRGHGLSHNLGGDSTIEECANDLHKLLQSLKIPHPHMLVAHSLAGKVALKYLERCTTEGSPLPGNTWILDSLPMPYKMLDDDTSDITQSVAHVVKALDILPMPQPTRAAVIKGVTDLGIALPVAQWLSTSLKQTSDGKVTWVFDLKVVKQLFVNFIELDMRSFLEEYEGEGVIHFVRAGRSEKWTSEVLAFFNQIITQQSQQAGGHKSLQLHTMPLAGHWLHSEDLSGLLKIMSENYVHRPL
jgi:pimeloyl-ACP methyl ester carboxylesterase